MSDAKAQRRAERQKIIDRMNQAKDLVEMARIRRELEAFDKEGK
jgi:hypothetical protein